MKRILFVNRQAPFGRSYAKESLDALLAGSAYDQDISVLFSGDGVFQLIKEQQAKDIGQKNIAATLPALEMYDITKIFAQASALNARGLKTEQLAIDIKPLTDAEISTLTQNQDCILSF